MYSTGMVKSIFYVRPITVNKPLLVEPRYRSQCSNHAKGLTIRPSNFERGKRFSLFQNFQTGSGVQPATCSKGKKRYSAGVNFPGTEADQSPSSSAEVKNEWKYASALPMCLNSLYRNNVNCTFIYNQGIIIYRADSCMGSSLDLYCRRKAISVFDVCWTVHHCDN